MGRGTHSVMANKKELKIQRNHFLLKSKHGFYFIFFAWIRRGS